MNAERVPLASRLLRVLFRCFPPILKEIAFRGEFRRRFNTNIKVGLPFRLSCLRYVGKYSYGTLNVVSYGNDGEGIEIGEFVSIAPDVIFHLGGNHDSKLLSTFPFETYLNSRRYDGKESYSKGAIVVGDDVWIGAGSKILSGVTIGQGAIIGAYAVVAKSVPPYAIAVGNPARVVKFRFEKEVIEMLTERFKPRELDPKTVRELAPLFRTEVSAENISELLAQITKR